MRRSKSFFRSQSALVSGTLSALLTERRLALAQGLLEALHALGALPFVRSLAAHRALTLTQR